MRWMSDEIEARGGEVDFATFMWLALYQPAHGYYTSGPPRTGRDGDFLTAPTASAWYGRVLGRLLGRLAAAVGPLRLVDVAAGDGRLLEAVAESVPAASVRRVVAVESSPAQRERLRARLAERHIEVLDDGRALEPEPEPTVVHASELYDALPVHRVVHREAGLAELWVAVDGGILTWRERPARPELVAYFEGHDVELVAGQLAEANLAAGGLHRELLGRVGETGVAIVLDYGYPARQLYDPRGRRQGSLTTFHRHRLGRDPLAAPGEQDLTAHVNWDDLCRAAEAAGWHDVALLPLAELLVRGGLAPELEARGFGPEAELDAATVAVRQEIKRLLDPEGMGSDLKALIQATPTMMSTIRDALDLDDTVS